ncbi:MAG: MarR family winged helix-turn-helix transcriptional regulator [Acetatifactor sp.]
MENKRSIKFAHDLIETYSERCKPLCREIQMPQTAFDILMFLANNPEYNTARDIVEIRGLKANLVSINIEKLVKEGFLERMPDAKDRRKNVLICTENAKSIIEKGRQLQIGFFGNLFDGIDKESRRQFFGVIEKLRTNLDNIRKEG